MSRYGAISDCRLTVSPVVAALAASLGVRVVPEAGAAVALELPTLFRLRELVLEVLSLEVQNITFVGDRGQPGLTHKPICGPLTTYTLRQRQRTFLFSQVCSLVP